MMRIYPNPLGVLPEWITALMTVVCFGAFLVVAAAWAPSFVRIAQWWSRSRRAARMIRDSPKRKRTEFSCGPLLNAEYRLRVDVGGVDEIVEPVPFFAPGSICVNGVPVPSHTSRRTVRIPASLIRGEKYVVISGTADLGALKETPDIAASSSRVLTEVERDPDPSWVRYAEAMDRGESGQDAATPPKNLDDELAALEARWSAYDTDLSAILDRPFMRQLSEPAVQDVVRARARVRRHSDATSTREREDGIDAFAAALDAAERAADARGAQALPADEREHVERARDLLRVIESAASSDAERALAYDRLRAAVARMGHLAIAPEKLPLLLPAGTVHTLGRSLDPRAEAMRTRQEA